MVVLFILLILLILLLLLMQKKEGKKKGAKRRIPKKIWTYWHNDNLPPVVKACIDSWKVFNPEYEITILNNKKVKELCDFDLEKLSIPHEFRARYADYARLIVLYKYGGVWMDSTIICTQSLDWTETMQKNTGAEFIGYYAPQTSNKKYPIPENWFFAAIPNSQFINDWFEEALLMNSFSSEEDYVKSVVKMYDIQNLTDLLPYLVMHLCATVVFQKNHGKYNVHLIDTMDPEHGAFRYLFSNNWELPRSIEQMCVNKDLQTSLIKLRGTERRFIEENSNRINCKKEDTNSVIYNVVKAPIGT